MSILHIHIGDTYQKHAYDFGTRIGLIITPKILIPKFGDCGSNYPMWYMNNNFKINIWDEIKVLYPDGSSGYDHIWQDKEKFVNEFFESFKKGFMSSMNLYLERNNTYIS